MSQIYKLPLVLEPQPEGGYTVTCPLLPELITEEITRRMRCKMQTMHWRLSWRDWQHLENPCRPPDMPNPIYVIGHVNPDADSIVVRRRQRGAGCGGRGRERESDHARKSLARVETRL